MIPDYASAQFFVRATTRNQLQDLKTKLENCFKAAALATGCQIKISWSAQGQIDGK